MDNCILVDCGAVFFSRIVCEKRFFAVKRMWMIFFFQLTVENSVGKVENLLKSYRL